MAPYGHRQGDADGDHGHGFRGTDFAGSSAVAPRWAPEQGSGLRTPHVTLTNRLLLRKATRRIPLPGYTQNFGSLSSFL
jgi:hypothetical protein